MTVSAPETPTNTIANTGDRGRRKNQSKAKLAAVREFVEQNPAATVREIADALGLSGAGYAHRLLTLVRAELCACPTCGGRGSIRTSAPAGATTGADFQRAKAAGT